MLNTFGVLAQSRKFWILTFAVLAIVAGTIALATGRITVDGFVPFVTSITALGGISISAIAWEDGKKKGTPPTPVGVELVSPPPAPIVTMNVAPGTHPDQITSSLKAVTAALKDGAS